MAVAEVQTYLIDTREADQDTWNSVRFIARAAFTNTLLQNHDTDTKQPLRSQAEIDFFVGWNDNADYFDYMANPNLLVGGRIRENQQFWNARLGLVSIFGELAGFIYAADNTSGNSRSIRWAKHHVNKTNHLWIKTVAVLPQFQEMPKYQLGTQLLKTVLGDAPGKQPVSTYVFPKETPGIQETLQRHGFIAGVSEHMQPFGPGSRETPQVRMHASSAALVLDHIKDIN